MNNIEVAFVFGAVGLIVGILGALLWADIQKTKRDWQAIEETLRLIAEESHKANQSLNRIKESVDPSLAERFYKP